MTHDIESIFPGHISDKTAAVLSECLHILAGECDTRYAHQLRRYYANQRVVYDPDHPWISPPFEPDL
jgi:hypothetical protein